VPIKEEHKGHPTPSGGDDFRRNSCKKKLYNTTNTKTMA
jgi:hypothetical protein